MMPKNKMKTKSLAQKIYRTLKKVPPGKITTYKELAEATGTKAYQAVGQILRKNPNAPEVPCHRVIKSDGTIGGYKGKKEHKGKKELLKKEGITIEKNKITNFEKIKITRKELIQ